ncbi:MAG: autotransporter outer membrane beta-barrel domain-containing protein [Zoogloeaceae bacterium]|jgi:hypothetical protein|nr:autotransporter outer membrane beta-barrel domain-containing protein [Zoogloeaceae bacterium]
MVDHGQLYHGFGVFRVDFVVTIEATGKRPPGKHRRCPVDQFAGIAAIGKDFPKAGDQAEQADQDGDRVRLTTGDPVKFNAVDSQRTRLGAKWDYQLNKSASAYLGAAWEHEFDGKAKATAYGEAIDAPELQGNTGMVEAGLTLIPAANQLLSIDLGLQGYTGKREGVTGGVRVRYAF